MSIRGLRIFRRFARDLFQLSLLEGMEPNGQQLSLMKMKQFRSRRARAKSTLAPVEFPDLTMVESSTDLTLT